MNTAGIIVISFMLGLALAKLDKVNKKLKKLEEFVNEIYRSKWKRTIKIHVDRLGRFNAADRIKLKEDFVGLLLQSNGEQPPSKSNQNLHCFDFDCNPKKYLKENREKLIEFGFMFNGIERISTDQSNKNEEKYVEIWLERNE